MADRPDDKQLSERALEVKRQLAEGTYEVDLACLAETLLDSGIVAPRASATPTIGRKASESGAA